MTGRVRPVPGDRARASRLGLALAAGPLAWMGRLLISLSLVPYACQSTGTWLLHLISVGFGLVAAAALTVSYRCRRELRVSSEAGGAGADRNRFLALLAVAVNGAALLAIVLEALAAVVIDPCLR